MHQLQLLLRRAVPVVLLLVVCTSPALCQGFGTNKILYQPLHWLVTDAPHVQLYFYPEEAALARTALALAESTCVEYEHRLNHKLSEPIPIFLYSSHRDFESTNILAGVSPEEVGGVTELLRGRVLVPHTGSYARLVHVMRHELVHAFMLDQFTVSAHRSHVVMRQEPPLWIVEGWAEHLSGGWTSDDDMVLRTAVLGGDAQDLDGLWRIEGTFLMYKEGQSFLDYVADHVGGSAKIGQLFDLWPRKQDLNACSKELWGKSLAEWGHEWFNSVKRRYYPLVSRRQEASEFATALPARGDFNLRPAVVPGAPGDSLRLVHFSDQGGYPGVWLWRRGAHGSEETRLVRAGNHRGFESLHFFQTQMAANKRGELAVVSRKGSHDVIHILAVTDGSEIATYESPALISLSSPSWSPGGDSLVVRGQGLSGDADLYLVERHSGRWTPLTQDSYDDKDPVFSPDGRSVTFSSDRGVDGKQGNYHLFERSPDGRLAQLTYSPGDEGQPSWSPDGKRLLFVSDRSGIPDLHLYDPSKGVAELTRVQGAAWDPTWQAGSRKLVFSQYNAGRFQMFEMAVVDSQLHWQRDPEPPANAVAWTPMQARADSRIGEYHRRWGVGLVQTGFGSNPDAGGGSAGQLALQDLLGNEEVDFFFNSTGEGFSNLLQNLDLGATYINQSQRLSYGYGLFRLNQIYDSRYDVLRTEHRTGGQLVASYPLTRFDRLESYLVFRHTENHLFSDGTVGGTNLVSHYLSFVHDNAWMGPYGFSAGWRLLFSAGQTRDLSHTKGNFWTLRVDGRRYLELLPGVVWVSRLRGELVSGSDVEPVFAGGFGDVRGFDRREISGNRVAVMNQELRFPLIRSLVISLPGGGVRMPDIQAALFADAATHGYGNWEKPVGSVGVGFFMGGGYYPSIRFDLAKRHDGLGWQKGMNSQFGIGFDF